MDQNKLMQYAKIENGISLEIEFASFHGTYVIVEQIRDTLNIDIEYVPGQGNIATHQRRYWLRESASSVKINNELRKEIQREFQTDKSIYTHKIITNVLKTNEDLKYVQKLLTLLGTPMHDGLKLGILSDDTFRASIRVHTDTKMVEERTILYLLGSELKKLYKEETNITVFVDGSVIEYKGFHSLQQWYELRNTIFLVEEITQTIIKTEQIEYNLNNLVKSKILREYVSSKSTLLHINSSSKITLYIDKNGSTKYRINTMNGILS